jgi:hypothetical protein
MRQQYSLLRHFELPRLSLDGALARRTQRSPFVLCHDNRITYWDDKLSLRLLASLEEGRKRLGGYRKRRVAQTRRRSSPAFP